MKQIILILSFSIFCFTTIAQTNVYHQFPDSTYWRVNAWGSWHGCWEEIYYHYYFEGDTVFNNIQYRKLYRSEVLVNSNQSPPCGFLPWQDAGYAAAIRDDPQTFKTYAVLYTDTVEDILYDYSLNSWDTLKGHFASGTSVIKIGGVDSILVRNSYRKRWKYQRVNGIDGYYVAGLASSSGFFEWLTSYASSTLCVGDSNGVVHNFPFIGTGFIGCQPITAVEEKENEPTTVVAFPNPSRGIVRFNVDEKIELLEVYNIFGSKVYDEVNPDDLVDLSDLKSGVYLVRLFLEGSIINSQKILLEN